MNYLIFIYFMARETDIERGEVTCPESHSQGVHAPKACVLTFSPGVCLMPSPRRASKVWQDRPAPQRVQFDITPGPTGSPGHTHQSLPWQSPAVEPDPGFQPQP